MIDRVFDPYSLSPSEYLGFLSQHVSDLLGHPHHFGSVTISAGARTGVVGGYNLKSVADELNGMNEPERIKIIKILEKQWDDKKVKTLKEFDDMQIKCDFILESHKTYMALKSQFDILLPCQATSMMKDLLGELLKGRSVKSYQLKARSVAYTQSLNKVSC